MLHELKGATIQQDGTAIVQVCADPEGTISKPGQGVTRIG